MAAFPPSYSDYAAFDLTKDILSQPSHNSSYAPRDRPYGHPNLPESTDDAVLYNSSRRRRAEVACVRCRKLHIKCSGNRGAGLFCDACQDARKPVGLCIFEQSGATESFNLNVNSPPTPPTDIHHTIDFVADTWDLSLDRHMFDLHTLDRDRRASPSRDCSTLSYVDLDNASHRAPDDLAFLDVHSLLSVPAERSAFIPGFASAPICSETISSPDAIVTGRPVSHSTSSGQTRPQNDNHTARYQSLFQDLANADLMLPAIYWGDTDCLAMVDADYCCDAHSYQSAEMSSSDDQSGRCYSASSCAHR